MKTMLHTLLFIIVFGIVGLNGQTLIPDLYYTPKHFKNVNFTDYFGSYQEFNIIEIDTTGETDVSAVIQYYLDSVKGSLTGEAKYNSCKVVLPAGKFLITQTVSIPGNIILKGISAEETIIHCKTGEGKPCFEIKPNNTQPLFSIPLNDTFKLRNGILTLYKDSVKNHVQLKDFNGYMAFVLGNDSAMITDSEAKGSIKEHFWGKIDTTSNVDEINLNAYYFDTVYTNRYYYEFYFKINNYNSRLEPTALQYLPESKPGIEGYEMVRGAGLSCFTLDRLDTTVSFTPNILLQNATECMVKAIISKNCNDAHIQLLNSTHNIIKRNYISHTNDNQSEKKGYGIFLSNGSAHNSLFDNVIHHLRHGIVLQNGANHNVLISNYIHSSVRNQSPTDGSGDIVLKENYPFSNLIEINIADQLVIENSKGIIGPYNIIHRNRLLGYGIIMEESNGSDFQVFSGNEILNEDKGLFKILDSNHFIYGNKIKNEIIPVNSSNNLENYILDRSYSCSSNRGQRRLSFPIFSCPYDLIDSSGIFLPPPIGPPFNQSFTSILAFRNKDSMPKCYDKFMDDIHYSPSVKKIDYNSITLSVYPNPSEGNFKINLTGQLTVIDLRGKIVKTLDATDENQVLHLTQKGLFILKLTRDDGIYTCRLVVY
jgi:hypothetical protein